MERGFNSNEAITVAADFERVPRFTTKTTRAVCTKVATVENALRPQQSSKLVRSLREPPSTRSWRRGTPIRGQSPEIGNPEPRPEHPPQEAAYAAPITKIRIMRGQIFSGFSASHGQIARSGSCGQITSVAIGRTMPWFTLASQRTSFTSRCTDFTARTVTTATTSP